MGCSLQKLFFNFCILYKNFYLDKKDESYLDPLVKSICRFKKQVTLSEGNEILRSINNYAYRNKEGSFF